MPSAVVVTGGGGSRDAAGAAVAFPALVTLPATGSTHAGVRGLLPLLCGAPRLTAFAIREFDDGSAPPVRLGAGPTANRLAGLVAALHPAAPLAVLYVRGMGADEAALSAVTVRAGVTLIDLPRTHAARLGSSGRGERDTAAWVAAGAALRV